MNIPKMIFIIPYRNRLFLKTHFQIYMKYILEDILKEDYEIYFVHQSDKRPFNRGGMKNIGFLAMREKYPNHYRDITFIFNDIDTTPAEKNIINYITNHGVVKHFYGFNFALGGIVSITGADFEKCGGFPNFWAWGFEDNALNARVIQHNIHIDRTTFYTFFDPHIINIRFDTTRILSKEQAFKQNSNETYHDIKNLKYKIENEFIRVEYFDTIDDPSKETYYRETQRARIPKDQRFNPNPTPQNKFKQNWNNININRKFNTQSTLSGYNKSWMKF